MSYYLSQEISRLLAGEDKRKPTIPVEVDWSHPLARGVKYLIVNNADIKNGQYAIAALGTTSSLERSNLVTDGTDAGDIQLYSNLSPSSLLNGGISVRFKIDIIGSTSAVFSSSDMTGYSGIDILVDSAGYVQIRLGKNTGGINSYERRSFTCTTTQLTDNVQFHTVTAFPRSLTTIDVYVDGVLQSYTTSGTAVSVSAGTALARVGKTTANGIYGTCEIESIAVFDGYYSQSDVFVINQNPYAFLKPAANAPIYLATAGVTGADHNLLAASVESASAVSAPTINQIHALTATSVESASVVSTPSISQVHVLTSTPVESASEVSTPTLQTGGTDNLLANDVESASAVSTPSLAQVHTLLANDVAALTEVSSAALTQLHVLLATGVESASTVSSPSLDRQSLENTKLLSRFESYALGHRGESNYITYR